MLTAEQLERLRSEPLVGRNKVLQAMELAGVTQARVAEGTGHTQPYVSSIANGKYADQLPLETARRFADFFGSSIEDLFPKVEREALAS